MFQNETGKAECKKCPDGSVVVPGEGEGIGNIDCISCGPGTYLTTDNATNRSECKPCSVGTYQNGTGETKCVPCTGGQYTNTTGAAVCSECPKGYIVVAVDGSNVDCTACPKGTYQDELGQITCKSCTDRTYQDMEGQEECKLCEDGKEVTENGTKCITPKKPMSVAAKGAIGGSVAGILALGGVAAFLVRHLKRKHGHLESDMVHI